jgi:uncharacterized membrane protein YagU involved in acid resistance
MRAPLATTSLEKPRAFRAVATAGLIAGILDITSAFVIWGLMGIGPIRGLQGIAAGLLGPQSFQGGLPTAGLGVAIHFLIAFVAAFVFYAASRKLIFLTKHAITSGMLYGIAVYGFMYWIVMPLASIKVRHSVSANFTRVLIHMFLVGLPIALVVRLYSKPRVHSS